MEKTIDISLANKKIVSVQKRKVYEKIKSKEFEAKSGAENIDVSNSDPVSAALDLSLFFTALAFDIGVGIPYSLMLKSQEGEEKSGTIKSDWETVDAKNITSEPVTNTSVKVNIPELDFQKSFQTDEKGQVRIFLEDLPRFRSLKSGMTVEVKSETKKRTYSGKKAFSGDRMTAMIEKTSHPAQLVFDLQFQDESGDGALDAGEEGKLIFNVANEGKGDAFGVVLRLQPKDWMEGIRLQKKHEIGRIQAKESKKVEVEIRAAKSISTSRISFQARLREEFGFDSDPRIVRLQTERFHPPKLAVADFGIDDRNQNAQVEPVEVVQIKARIKNEGRGKAKDAVARIDLGQDVFFAPGSEQEFSLGELSPGEAKDISFSFLTNKRIDSGERIPVRIHLQEERADFKDRFPLNLTMNAPQQRIEETVIAKTDPSSGDAGQKRTDSPHVEVDHDIPEGVFADKEDIALLIGNRHYLKQGVPDVAYAHRDVNVLKRYLRKTMGFEKIFMVKGATKGDFQTWFGTEENPGGRLSNHVNPGQSRVFVYYVGHGAPGPLSQERYFVPVDANPDYIESAGYPASRFYNNLKSLSSQELIVVLDACFSGYTQEGLLFKNVSPAQLVETKSQDVELSQGVVMSSAKPDELSVWYPQKRHSLFTYYFLKGLRGGADQDKDRRITTGEIMEYVSERVPFKAEEIANRKQVPVLRGDPDLVLTNLQKK